jgi:hypothetical protein
MALGYSSILSTNSARHNVKDMSEDNIKTDFKKLWRCKLVWNGSWKNPILGFCVDGNEWTCRFHDNGSDFILFQETRTHFRKELKRHANWEKCTSRDHLSFVLFKITEFVSNEWWYWDGSIMSPSLAVQWLRFGSLVDSYKSEFRDIAESVGT